MNTKIVVGVIGAIVVLGGGYLLYARQTPTLEDSTEETTESATTPETATQFEGSFRDLAMRGGSYRCEIVHTVEANDAQSSGVVYVDGSKVRSDFTTNVSGYGEMESHMITDGEWMYTWSPAMPQGMKMRVMAAGENLGVVTWDSGQYADMNQAYNFDCDPWSADVSVFAPPTGITFSEFTMPQMPAGMPTQ